MCRLISLHHKVVIKYFLFHFVCNNQLYRTGMCCHFREKYTIVQCYSGKMNPGSGGQCRHKHDQADRDRTRQTGTWSVETGTGSWDMYMIRQTRTWTGIQGQDHWRQEHDQADRDRISVDRNRIRGDMYMIRQTGAGLVQTWTGLGRGLGRDMIRTAGTGSVETSVTVLTCRSLSVTDRHCQSVSADYFSRFTF